VFARSHASGTRLRAASFHLGSSLPRSLDERDASEGPNWPVVWPDVIRCGSPPKLNVRQPFTVVEDSRVHAVR